MRAIVLAALLAQTAHATPVAGPPTVARTRGAKTAVTTAPRHDGAHARVTFLAGRQPREAVGRREEPLTPEEDTAKQIQKVLRGPLRNGITGIYVADARTGDPLFAVNADDPLNPASNVKMISTATALEELGADFRYSTRLFGPEPDDTGTIRGNVYLLGTYDPTLTPADLDELGAQLAAKNVHELVGNVLVGSDPVRDGVFRAVVPIDIRASVPNEPPIVLAPEGFDLVTFKVTAKTGRTAGRPHLTYAAETVVDPAGHLRIQLTIGGTIGKGGAVTYPFVTKEYTQLAAHAVRAALRAHGISVSGDVAVAELGDFFGDAVVAGELPAELARHDSATLADIITKVNKWSINWLADRVIMTATALARREAPTMEIALDAMYQWLARHPHVDKNDALIDTGSGLSYHTRVTPHELVAVVRSAAGFATDSDPTLGKAWMSSLSVGGTDGTLTRRFLIPETRGRLHAKTGTLSTVIALSGVLDFDPQRPLAFSIVTNGDRPLSKGGVRRAHEQLVTLLCKYQAKTAKTPVPPPIPLVAPPALHPMVPDDFEESDPEPSLDEAPVK